MLSLFNQDHAMKMFIASERKEAKEEGSEERMLDCLRKIMFSLKVSAERALEILSVPEDEWPSYLAALM